MYEGECDLIKIIVLNSISDVMELISDQKYNDKIQRLRSPYLYRGAPDASYKLTTSLRRTCKHLYRELEPSVLRNFTKYASIEDPTLSSSIWKQMIVGQHHGLPTRLLDFTRSPMIALHFALTENNLDKLGSRDSVIWRIDTEDINRNLPQKYKEALEEETADIFSVGMLTKIAPDLEQYDADMGSTALVNIEPPSIDQRIINQYSFFSVIPSGMTDIERFLDERTQNTVCYIIKKELRWDARDLLDQFNVNERLMYPGLDGLSSAIARHYFVRNDDFKEQ